MPNPFTLYHQATNSWPAAALLFQIAYWAPKAKVRRGPHLWVAKTAAEWCAETDLTHEQYKDAVAALRQLGLIVTAPHRFAGKTITHLRLTEAGRALTGVVGPGGTSTQGVVGPGGTNGEGVVVPGGTDPLTGPTSTGPTKVQDKDCVLAHASPPGGEKKQVPGKGESQEPEMKVKDALEKFHKQDKSAQLELLWKSLVAEVTGDFVPTFSAKQRGQLKTFVGKCPAGAGVQVLEHTLRHWVPFTSAAEDEAGAYKTPLKPDVGFLLRYVSVAINLWIEDTQKKPKAASKTPMQSTAPAPLPPEPEPPNESMTLDQMYNLLFEDLNW